MTTIKDFQIVSKLGEGAYSTVYKVIRLTDSQEYALKQVKMSNLSDKEKQNALNEVRILASIKHPNIISYKEAFLEENSNSLCIVMEYANNGDLFQKISEHQKRGVPFNESEIWNIFIQMTKALKELHGLKIFHRDLKSANVFLNKDGTVKLGDLNVSKIAKKGLLYTQTGTPYYASPEVWKELPYDHKSDVWSLGCVLYEMTTLHPPFRAEDMEGLYKKVIRGYYPRIPTHYSQDLSNVIRALLQVTPQLRPSCDRILLLPAIYKRIDERHLFGLEEGLRSDLLSTIRVPKSFLFLTERLPKANYNPLKTKKIEKIKFLQTLAGYKDLSTNHSIAEDLTKETEGTEHYKKNKDYGKAYLPSVGKEAHSKYIMKIYGDRDKERRGRVAKLRTERSHETNISNIIFDDSTDYETKSIKQSIKARRLKNVETAEDKESIDTEILSKGKSSEQVPYRLPPYRAPYKVHNLNDDVVFEKQQPHQVRMRQIYGEKSLSSILNNSGVSVGKDSVHSMLRRHKNQVSGRSPSQEQMGYEIDSLKQSKLPPLAREKHIRLPALHRDKSGETSIGPKKEKLKEISKLYRINLGSLDDIPEKYAVVAKPSKKERHSSMPKEYNRVNNILDYSVNRARYRKGYDENFYNPKY